MKDTIKRVLLAIAVIISILAIAYSAKTLIDNVRTEIYQAGFQKGIDAVFISIESSLKQSGSVIFTTEEGGQVILVPKIDEEGI